MHCGDVLVSVVVFVCLSVCLFGFFKYCIISVFVTNKRIYELQIRQAGFTTITLAEICCCIDSQNLNIELHNVTTKLFKLKMLQRRQCSLQQMSTVYVVTFYKGLGPRPRSLADL